MFQWIWTFIKFQLEGLQILAMALGHSPMLMVWVTALIGHLIPLWSFQFVQIIIKPILLAVKPKTWRSLMAIMKKHKAFTLLIQVSFGLLLYITPRFLVDIIGDYKLNEGNGNSLATSQGSLTAATLCKNSQLTLILKKNSNNSSNLDSCRKLKKLFNNSFHIGWWIKFYISISIYRASRIHSISFRSSNRSICGFHVLYQIWFCSCH